MSKTKTKAPAPTKSEKRIVKTVSDRRASRTAIPRLKMAHDEEGRINTVSLDHDDQQVALALSMHHCGTDDIEFLSGLLKQVAALTDPGHEFSESAANFALAAIRCIEPRDEIEAMLAAQMAATHQLSMQSARRMTLATTLDGKDSAEREFNKLARTYTSQLDALKRYRAKAQQVVRVERVTVNEGGQAIVGEVRSSGAGL